MRRLMNVCLIIASLFTAARATAQCGMKNVIIMIADGWGYNQILTADYYRGASAPYESFPVRVAMSTYSYDGWGYTPSQAWADFSYLMQRATDSASAATAMSTGVKIHDGQINVDPVTAEPLFTTRQRAEELGKATGVITSVEWSHATPAGWAAHNISRDNYAQIAQEMLGGDCEVIMGCGHPWFSNNSVEYLPHPTAESAYQYVGGSAAWANLMNGELGWTLVQDSMEFVNLALDHNPPMKVCGTAKCRTTLQQARTPGESGNSFILPYTVPQNRGVPKLADMSRAALNVLRHADAAGNGIFLMIEGGAVDWANHAGQAGRLIEELSEFNAAVSAVIAWVETHSNWNETLLIVTGDHETGYLWGPSSGYPAVWNPIVDNEAEAMPGGRYYSGSHTNSLIPLFAKGIGSVWLDQWAMNVDSRRGRYLDNTNIADLIFGYFDCTLAVELLSFEAAVTENGVNLEWATASETDNDHFEILRDGAMQARIASAGNTPEGHHYEWLDSDVESRLTYTYVLMAVDVNGVREELGRRAVHVFGDDRVSAGEFALDKNYPNPFNPATTIPYTLRESGWVSLTVYNALGQQVSSLVNGYQAAGSHEIVFNGADLPSGIYFYSLTFGKFSARNKMALIK